MGRTFEIDDTITRRYSRFNATGTELTTRLLPPSNDDDARDPVGYFLASVNDHFEQPLQNVSDSDMLGNTIQNRANQYIKHIGISFRRKDQVSGDVIWSVFERVSESNSRINALDTQVVTVHLVRMPVGFGKCAIKRKGRSLPVMAHLKKSIIEFKRAVNG